LENISFGVKNYYPKGEPKPANILIESSLCFIFMILKPVSPIVIIIMYHLVPESFQVASGMVPFHDETHYDSKNQGISGLVFGFDITT
jgi:hypothetical protein